MPDAPSTSRARRILKRIGEPTPYSWNTPFLNAMGIQVARVVLANARHQFGRHDSHQVGYLRDIEQRGIAVVPDFLPAEDFARLRGYVQDLVRGPNMQRVEDEFGTGLECIRGAIGTNTEAGRWIIDRVAAHPVVALLVHAVTKRRLSRLPRVVYQRLHLPARATHQNDVEAILHADRHYPTVKAYLTLAPIDKKNGAFVWCDGSHRISAARLRYEYEFSNLKSRNTIDAIRIARSGALESSRAELGLRESTIEAAANTLVLSNNCGFHRRGFLTPGSAREQLRMTFHYMHEPLYVRQGWSAVRWLAAHGGIPRHHIEWLQRRGYL